MALEFSAPVKTILSKVVEVTGKEFDMVERPDMVQLAGVKTARKGMPRHIIHYRVSDTDILNHLIAHECGHILRMSGVPEEQRRVPVSNRVTMTAAFTPLMPEVERIVAGMPGNVGPELLGMLYNGLVRQVTNFPADIAIERWLAAEYPDLHDAQRASLRRQLRDSEAGLDRKVRVMTPELIYTAANTMNYTFFLFIEEALGEPFLGRFAGSPFKESGLRLAEITRALPLATHIDDNAMVDAWAGFLKIAGWFEWTGFENTPPGYEHS